MGFVAARIHHAEYGQTAALILQMAAEMDISKFEIFTVPGGFQVPDAIADVLNPAADLSPVIPEPSLMSGAAGTPPAWWDEKQEESGIEVDAEGKVYVKALRPEAVQITVGTGGAPGEPGTPTTVVEIAEVYDAAIDGPTVATDHDEIAEVIYGTMELSADVTDLVPAAPAAPSDAEVRIWAEENGIKVSPKGRIAQSVLDAYKSTKE